MIHLLDRGMVTRAVVVAALLAVALFVLPSTLGGDWINTLTSVAIYSVVAAGLVVLYGKVGMISLGQIALLAIGTWTATRLSFLWDLPFPVLMLVTGAITCVIGVLIGLPALRLSGLYLALITLMGAGRGRSRPLHARLPERRSRVLRPPGPGRPRRASCRYSGPRGVAATPPSTGTRWSCARSCSCSRSPTS